MTKIIARLVISLMLHVTTIGLAWLWFGWKLAIVVFLSLWVVNYDNVVRQNEHSERSPETFSNNNTPQSQEVSDVK